MSDLLRSVVRLLDLFGDDLLLSFVGGSFATGRQKPTSDVDVFLLLAVPHRERERHFAERFLAIHAAAGVPAPHIGEVFAEATLDALLTSTEAVLEAAPRILETGCYHGDCILSVWRKGDVAMKFLADPKIEVRGDRTRLAALEARAARYFAKDPTPRIQTEIGRLVAGGGAGDAALDAERRVWEAETETQVLDTPVGIGLERWFGPPAIALSPDRRQARGTLPLARSRCPRSAFPDGSREAEAIAAQCMGGRDVHPRSQVTLDGTSKA